MTIAETSDTEFDENQMAYSRPKPDSHSNPAGEVGWYLQREREKRGQTYEDISEATGIHPYHLEAIEFGDLTRLPERLEALEMVGNYAEHMGFEPEPVVRHYATFLPLPALAPKGNHPADPAPLSSAKVIRFGKLPIPKFNIREFPGGAGGIVASCLFAIVLFAGANWMIQPQGGEPGAEIAQDGDPMATASTGESDAEVAVTEEAMPDDQPDEAASEPEETASTGQEPTSEEEALDGLTGLIEQTLGQPKSSAQKTKGEEKVAIAEPEAVKTAPDTSSRLTLKAKGPVWVRIEDEQGNVVMTQMLRKGDSYQVPDRKGLVVIARDGGLLSYSIDGKERGILGTPGQILVGQPLDLATLERQ
jgi:cytoskeleton protein RodZ